MTKAIVQTGTGKYQESSASTIALAAFGSTTTAGNSIYVYVYGHRSGGTGWAVSSIADTYGNTYALEKAGGYDSNGAGRSRPEIWAAHNIGAQASNVVTITLNDAVSQFTHAQAIEVSAGGLQSLDQSGHGNPSYNVATANATAGGENTDAGALSLFVAGEFIGGGGPTITLSLPTNYTSTYLFTATNGYKPACRFGYRILSSLETTAISTTSDHSPMNGAVVLTVANFKEPAGGNTIILPHRSSGGMIDLSGNFRG